SAQASLRAPEEATCAIGANRRLGCKVRARLTTGTRRSRRLGKRIVDETAALRTRRNSSHRQSKGERGSETKHEQASHRDPPGGSFSDRRIPAEANIETSRVLQESSSSSSRAA